MFIRSNLPNWLRKKTVWVGMIALFLLCFATWLIFDRFLGPSYLRTWLTVGFLRAHINKIAFILMCVLVILFLWAMDRMLASPDETNGKAPGDPPDLSGAKKVLHLLFAFLMVVVTCYTIYKIIMFGQSVHFWFTGDREWWEANKHLFTK